MPARHEQIAKTNPTTHPMIVRGYKGQIPSWAH